MKQLITYIFLLWVCAGCVHSVDERLACINSLADGGEPDSAMILLQSMEKSNLNEHNSLYYDLMTIKTRDKAYLDITNDSIVVDLISYFEDEGSTAEKAEAYYYGGRVYREMGDLPQSLDYFQKALDVLAHDDSSARLKGKISSQMGQMFFDLQMYDQAIPKFHIAVNHNKMFCDTINLVYNYKGLSSIYYKKCNADSTIIYLGKALDIATEIKKSPKYEIEIRNSIVDCHIKFGDYNLARNEYTKLDSIKSIHNDYNADYLVCTAINMSIINRDYNQTEQLAKQLSGSSSVHSRWFAYGILKDIAKQKKQETELYKYLGEYEKCIDSINAYASREAVVHQNSFYNYSLREKESHILKEQKNRIITRSLSAILLLFIAVFISLYAYRIIYKKNTQLNNKNKELDSENEILKTENAELLTAQERMHIELLQQLDKITLLEKHNESLKNNITDNEISEEILKRIQDRISNINTDNYDVDYKIISSNAYIILRKELNKDNGVANEKVWEELDNMVNEIYPNFKAQLFYLYSRLTNLEYRVCLLLKCKFSPKEIAILVFRDKSTISNIRTRLNNKFFGVKSSPSDFDKFILSL